MYAIQRGFVPNLCWNLFTPIIDFQLDPQLSAICISRYLWISQEGLSLFLSSLKTISKW